MQFSPLTKRLSGDGAKAWAIHFEAVSAQAAGKDVVVMSVGDSEFDTPSGIIDACISALQSGDTHYTAVAGRDRLREAIARNHQQKTGNPTTSENVIVSSGCQNALFNAAQIVLAPGDEVIVFEPMYVTYEAAFQAPGATIIPVPCPAALGFRPDLAAFRAAITEKTVAVVFANPVNPTGVVFPAEDIAVIAEIARQHDLWVIADEVYAELVFEGTHISIAALEGMGERTITVSSLSKSHAMTGWRAGWAIGPEAYVHEAEKLALCSTYGLPGFIQEAAAFALENRLEDVATMRNAFLQRRDLVMQELKKAWGLDCRPAQAGMFLIVDVRKTGLSGDEFVSRLYAEAGVSVLNGAAFGPSTHGTVRISFALPEEVLREGCTRIQTFGARLKKGETL